MTNFDAMFSLQCFRFCSTGIDVNFQTDNTKIQYASLFLTDFWYIFSNNWESFKSFNLRNICCWISFFCHIFYFLTFFFFFLWNINHMLWGGFIIRCTDKRPHIVLSSARLVKLTKSSLNFTRPCSPSDILSLLLQGYQGLGHPFFFIWFNWYFSIVNTCILTFYFKPDK